MLLTLRAPYAVYAFHDDYYATCHDVIYRYDADAVCLRLLPLRRCFERLL